MAIIPSGTQFIGLASTVNTVERRSAQINNESAPYTMQDIIDTVAPNVAGNPSVIDVKVADGIAVTGTTSGVVSQSILIPADTFSNDGLLEFMARYQKTGSAGSQTCAVYINTADNLTGATLIATFISGSGGGGGTNNYAQGIRTARINAGVLSIFPATTTGITDTVFQNLAQSSVVFNAAVDNYLLFTIQLVSAADSSVVQMARAVKYE